MENKVALITGITGQDGSYLAEFLLEKDTKYTAQSVVLLSTIASVSHILKVPHTSTSTMPTWVTL